MELFALMGATLTLIHPILFAAGMNAIAKMAAGLFKCKELDVVKEVMLISVSFPLSPAKLAGKGLRNGPITSVQH